MKNLQIWIITLLIFALPVTSIAGITNLHCQNIDDEKQTEVSVESHCPNSESPNSKSNEVAKVNSSSDQCSCECPNLLGCATNGISSYVDAHVDRIIHPSQIDHYYDLFDKFISFQSPPLIRPPIYNS